MATDIKDYILYKQAGLIEKSEKIDSYENEIVEGKYNDIIEECVNIVDGVKQVGSSTIQESDYAELLDSISTEMFEKAKREENIYVSIKDKNKKSFFRIPEMIDVLYTLTSSQRKYAAATRKIKMFQHEEIDIENYSISYEIFKDEITLQINKDGNPFTGNLGFVLLSGGKEKKVSFDITDGVKVFLLSEDDEAENQNVKLRLFID